MVEQRKLCGRKVLKNRNKIFPPNYCIKRENFSDAKQKKQSIFATISLFQIYWANTYLTQYFAIIIKEICCSKIIWGCMSNAKNCGPPWAMLEV